MCSSYLSRRRLNVATIFSHNCVYTLIADVAKSSSREATSSPTPPVPTSPRVDTNTSFLHNLFFFFSGRVSHSDPFVASFASVDFEKFGQRLGSTFTVQIKDQLIDFFFFCNFFRIRQLRLKLCVPTTAPSFDFSHQLHLKKPFLLQWFIFVFFLKKRLLFQSKKVFKVFLKLLEAGNVSVEGGAQLRRQ